MSDAKTPEPSPSSRPCCSPARADPSRAPHPESTAPTRPRPPPKRERKFWDIALSIVLIILSIGAYLTGALIGLLGIALFGNCPTGTCGGETVTTTGLVLLGVLVLGSAATIGLLRAAAARLVARRRRCSARSSSPGSSATRLERFRRLSL